jgi:hypothetical protein
MLIASRDARWVGSRILPIGIAVVTSGCTVAPMIWVGLLAIPIAWVVLLPAAWSHYANAGRETRQPWAGRLSSAISLVPATFGLPILLGLLLVELTKPQSQPPQQWYVLGGADLYHQTGYIGDTRLAVDSEGSLLTSGPLLRNHWKVEPAMLRFRHVSYGMYGIDSYRSVSSLLCEGFIFIPGGGSEARRVIYIRPWNVFAVYARRLDEDPVVVEYIGRNGYVSTREQAVPFAPVEESRPMVAGVVVEAHAVLEPTEHVVRNIFVAPAGETCMCAGIVSRAEKLPVMAVTTDQATYLLSVDSDRSIERPYSILCRYPHPSGDYAYVYAGMNIEATTFAFYYVPDHMSLRPGPSLFVRVSAAGDEVSRTVVPPLPSWSATPSPWETLVGRIVPPPPLAVLIPFVDHTPRNLLFIPVLIAVGSACGAWLILRFYTASRSAQILWSTACFIGGIGSLLLMIAVRYWPTRITCPSCGHPRTLHPPLCRHCGAVLPAPDPGAIGIFDHADAQSLAPAVERG